MPRSADSHSQLQRLFEESDELVRARFASDEDARAHYRPYLEFVENAAPGRGTLLDVGCGGAWTARLFAQDGFDVIGVDLNAKAFAAVPHERLRLVQGSVLALPFASASFDVVATHEMLEHVPSPRRALDEMLRVVKPGGLVCIAGPNLLSPAVSVRALTTWLWEQKPRRRLLFRDAAMPRHPFGNTAPEIVATLARNTWLLAGKLASRHASFSMREPDLRPPFHADNDACYLCNPLDLVRYFEERKASIVRRAKLNRNKRTWLLAGGTWIVARKGVSG